MRGSAKGAPLCPQRRARPEAQAPGADLPGAIRADPESSLFSGEGHRKLRARLYLTRKHRLPPLHRRPQGVSALRAETITADHPTETRGAGGTRIEATAEGWVRMFSAVDQLNACCVSVHAVRMAIRWTDPAVSH